MLLSILARLMWKMFQNPNFLAFSPWHALRQLAAWCAGVEVEPGFDREWALLSVFCMTVLAALWMRWHLKPVEVVG